jgi:alkylation response protein AidB-like acyl-CoA dehydrogenase
MNFDVSEVQKILADQARRLLAERASPDRLRALIDEGAEWDEPLWREVADLGFLGAAIPEAYGGLGLTELDLGVISEELGRANVALPFFSSIVLAAGLIQLAGDDRQKAKWLPELASGKTVATFAYCEGPAGWSDIAVKATFDGGILNGVKTPVADGGIASLALVLTKRDGRLSFALVELDQPGVTRVRLDGFDQLRPHYRLAFENVSAEAIDAVPADRALDILFDRAAVQAAFEGVGGADACLEAALAYAKERQIFGRSLASYQAIKHKLADIAKDIELARSNAYYAGWAAESGSEALPLAAASARLSAIKTFENAARENIQVHGGIGYTYEANCHFYYRRERTLATNLGGREIWADRLIATIAGSQAKEA